MQFRCRGAWARNDHPIRKDHPIRNQIDYIIVPTRYRNGKNWQKLTEKVLRKPNTAAFKEEEKHQITSDKFNEKLSKTQRNIELEYTIVENKAYKSAFRHARIYNNCEQKETTRHKFQTYK